MHTAFPDTPLELEAPPHTAAGIAERLRVRTANLCMLRALERIARRFNDAGVALLVLKGAALNLTVMTSPDERPMGDLDLLVRPADLERAIELLHAEGAHPGRPQVREDFFPRFHYEREFVVGDIFPVIVDLHVRPFRPLRYARLMPADAIWADAVEVQVGSGRVLVPSAEDMLIHLATHCAVHGHSRPMWLADMVQWVRHCGWKLDWSRFCTHAEAWGLALPVRAALTVVERSHGPVFPPAVHARMAGAKVNWRDRLTLQQAPRDAAHPAAHVFVNAVCTPGARFALSYLAAALLPDRRHMGEWYDWRHHGWKAAAYSLRLAAPALRHWGGLWDRLFKVELREGAGSGTGGFARRRLTVGECIAQTGRTELGSKVSRIRHSCRPNTQLRGRTLYALRAIEADEELTLDRGITACGCRQQAAGIRAKSA